DTDAVLADGAHPQLGLERDAELADDQDVERRPQRLRHLVRHRDPAARETEDERRRGPQAREPLGQPPACLTPVAEGHRTTIMAPAARSLCMTPRSENGDLRPCSGR